MDRSNIIIILIIALLGLSALAIYWGYSPVAVVIIFLAVGPIGWFMAQKDSALDELSNDYNEPEAGTSFKQVFWGVVVFGSFIGGVLVYSYISGL